MSSMQSHFEYFDALKSSGQLLQYDAERHPEPKYWPYQHDGKVEEMKEEGPEAWDQFDEMGDTEDQDKRCVQWQCAKCGVSNSNQDTMCRQCRTWKMTSEMVKFYAKYKQKRNAIKCQLHQHQSECRLQEDDVVIAMAGDGSMSGALGVGNGNVTPIPDNIASFPFLMTSLLGKRIKITAAGIMSSAVVTQDDELYVWGLNDKSELTINPFNLEQVDVGCDDDQLSSKEGWKRLYNHYGEALTAIYLNCNPSKINDPSNAGFVERLLEKRKIGRLMIRFHGKSKMHFGIYLIQETVRQLTSQFESLCRMNLKRKMPRHVTLEVVEEVDITLSAEKLHELYTKVCDKYNVPQQYRSSLHIPEATSEEMLERKHRKLNPHKYLNENKENSNNCNWNNYGNHSGYRQRLDYHGNVDTRFEDGFQGELACSYWTPAHIRLPTKMVIKQVTLGGTHMVVLDTLGRVFSSGTFSNDGPIGHHFDEQKDEVIRYQREMKQITNIEFIKYGDSNRRATNYNQNVLPRIKAIASGVNHILMLDYNGMVWQMGAVKLGQRWSARNIKKYLCPQRITGRGKKVVFEKVACGNHHNLAISRDIPGDRMCGSNADIQSIKMLMETS